jgi:hypothetical protein
MALEFSKTVIIGLIILACILMFAMVVEVVPCDASNSNTERFTSIESVLGNMSKDINITNSYMNILSEQDSDIVTLYDSLYNIKNRIKELN